MPSNTGYFVAAYVCAAVIYVAYGLSLVVRQRALRERLERETGATERT